MKSSSVIVETGFPVKDGAEDEGDALENSTASYVLEVCWFQTVGLCRGFMWPQPRRPVCCTGS